MTAENGTQYPSWNPCIEKLFSDFIEHPGLFWGANNTGCEARADLMAEIAAARGFDAKKIWVQPSDSQSYLPVYLNESGTERAFWSYHVAPLITGVGAAFVVDPALFATPVSLDDWKHRVSSLANEYDYVLSFRESSREAFYGPSDMLVVGGRERTLAKRKEILANAANLDDPTVFSGFLTRKRGLLADALKKEAAKKFKCLKRLLRNDEFAAWYRMPLRVDSLARILTEYDHYFGIESAEIRGRVDLSDPGAFTALQAMYWEPVGRALDRLVQKSEDLRFGAFSGERCAFQYRWELGSFRIKGSEPFAKLRGQSPLQKG